MKSAHRFFAGLTSMGFLLFLFSCKKNSSSANSCRIIAVYDTFTNAGLSPETGYTLFTYNNDGKIATEQFDIGGSKIFTYGDHLIVATPSVGLNAPLDSVYLNDKGQPTRVAMVYANSPDALTYVDYTYNSDGQLLTEEYIYPKIPSNNFKFTFTYSNGDAVSRTASYGGVLTYTYYTDKPSSTADVFHLYEYMNYGITPIQNKHLVKTSEDAVDLYNYTYTFDKQGNVLSETNLYGSHIDKYTLTYDCSN